MLQKYSDSVFFKINSILAATSLLATSVMATPTSNVNVPTSVVSTPEGALPVSQVDHASGNITLHEPLLGVGGYKASLKYNSEGVQDKASTWNREAPTGTVGLGWSMGNNRIVRITQQTATILDDKYILHYEGSTYTLIYMGAESSVSNYRVEAHPHWKVQFHTDKDQWQFWLDDGMKFVYGDGDLVSHTSHSTEHNVTWNNWVGSSVQQTTDSLSIGWNVSVHENIYGQQAKYYYTQFKEQVGTAANAAKHTRETYLNKVKGYLGQEVVFHYSNKNADEYQDPHTENGNVSSNDQDAYQERYETKYLDSLTLLNYEGGLERIVDLNYSILNSSEPLLKKRMLTEIAVKNQYGRKINPSKVFDYFGLISQDGVSAGLTHSQTTKYNTTNGALLGALKSETMPEGMVYGYQYGKHQIEGSSRSIDIDFPEDYSYTAEESSIDGYTATVPWGAPQLFFGDDYVVTLFELIDLDVKKTAVHVYQWIGDRWIKQEMGIYDGHFYDDYKSYDYYTKAFMTRLREGIMKEIGKEFPAMGGVMNAFNDALKDDTKMFYNVGKDLKDGKVGKAIKDWATGEFKLIKDIVLDIVAGFEKEAENIIDGFIDDFGSDHAKFHVLQKRLFEAYQDFVKKNPRKEYHIELQKDFFALTETAGGLSLNVFHKSKLEEGHWGSNSLPIHVTSRFVDLESGENFVAVLDELTDFLYIYNYNGLGDWDGYFSILHLAGYADRTDHKVNDIYTGDAFLSTYKHCVEPYTKGVANKDSVLKSSTFIKKYENCAGSPVSSVVKNIDDVPFSVSDYYNEVDDRAMRHSGHRSAIAARNNILLATVTDEHGHSGDIHLMYHDEGMNWNKSKKSFTKKETLFTDNKNLQDLYETMLGSDAKIDLKMGNTFAALQVYDNLDANLFPSPSDIPIVGDLVNDFVADYHLVNSTFGIIWDKDYSNIRFEHLHTGWAQTGVAVNITGDVINKVGKAYSLIVGSDDALAKDDGKNMSFRFDGANFSATELKSPYYSSAFAPDFVSTLIEDSDKTKKTPQFYQYNPNRAFAKTSQSYPENADAKAEAVFRNEIHARKSFTSFDLSTNKWDLISNASQEKINAPEFVEEAVNVAVDVLNVILQVVGLVVPMISEAIESEEALSALKKINQVADKAGYIAQVAGPVSDELIRDIMGTNHKSTSISNGYISVNGKIFHREPNGSWTNITDDSFSLGNGDSLVSSRNNIVGGHINYSLKTNEGIENYVKTLKNGKVHQVLSLNESKDGHSLVLHQDSVVQVEGPNAFVAYGPVDSKGFVVPNPDIEQYRPFIAPDAASRDANKSFKDAQAVRLYKIADDNVIGELSDYAVRRVSSNTGYVTSYRHYVYDTNNVSYKSSLGSAIYGKVIEIPTTKATLSSASLDANFPNGHIEYYFYNRDNHVGKVSKVGYPRTLDMPSNSGKDLIEYDDSYFEDNALFNSGKITPLYGRQYYQRAIHANGSTVSENVTYYKIWEQDLHHLTSDGHLSTDVTRIYPIRTTETINVLDGVKHKTTFSFDEYPLRLRSTSDHSTTVDGIEEVRTKTQKYAFELYSEMKDVNRFSEVAQTSSYIEKGSEPIRFLGSKVSSYKPWSMNGESRYAKEASYIAKISDSLHVDLANRDYAVLAASDVVKQDKSIFDYEESLRKYELLHENFIAATEASIAENIEARDSHRQVNTIGQELVEIRKDLALELIDLQEHNNLATVIKDKITSANQEHQGFLAQEVTKQAELDKAHADYNKAKRKRDIAAGFVWSIPGAIAFGILEGKLDAARAVVRAKETQLNEIKANDANEQKIILNLGNELTEVANLDEIIKTRIRNLDTVLTSTTNLLDSSRVITDRMSSALKDAHSKADLFNDGDFIVENHGNVKTHIKDLQNANDNVTQSLNNIPNLVDHVNSEIANVWQQEQQSYQTRVQQQDAINNRNFNDENESFCRSISKTVTGFRCPGRLGTCYDTYSYYNCWEVQNKCAGGGPSYCSTYRSRKNSYIVARREAAPVRDAQHTAISKSLDSLKSKSAISKFKILAYKEKLVVLYNSVVNSESHIKTAQAKVSKQEFLSSHRGQWIEAKRVLERDSVTGIPLYWEDVKNARHSILLDQNHRHAIATVIDANIQSGEAMYQGFEENEDSSNISGSSTGEEAHTGSKSLFVASGSQVLSFQGFSPKSQLNFADSAYILSAWVKHKGSGSSVSLSIEGGDTTKILNAKNASTAGSAESDWKYIEVVLKAPNGPNQEPQINVDAGGHGIYLDDIWLRPLESKVSTNTYTQDGKVAESVNDNGVVLRHIYDANDMHVTSIDDENLMSGISQHHFSRRDNSSFNTLAPNAHVNITLQGESFLLVKDGKNKKEESFSKSSEHNILVGDVHSIKNSTVSKNLSLVSLVEKAFDLGRANGESGGPWRTNIGWSFPMNGYNEYVSWDKDLSSLSRLSSATLKYYNNHATPQVRMVVEQKAKGVYQNVYISPTKNTQVGHRSISFPINVALTKEPVRIRLETIGQSKNISVGKLEVSGVVSNTNESIIATPTPDVGYNILPAHSIPESKTEFKDFTFLFSANQDSSFTIDKNGISLVFDKTNLKLGSASVVLDRFPENFAFVISGNKAFCFGDGKLLLHSDYTFSSSAGSYTGSFDYMTLGYGPVLAFTFSDAVGRTVQIQTLEYDDSNQIVGSSIHEIFYDGWGHKAVQTLVALDSTKYPMYQNGFVENLNWTTGSLDGALKEYFTNHERASEEFVDLRDDDLSYLASQNKYTTSPLARMSRSILPGSRFHTKESNQLKTSYQDVDGNSLALGVGATNTNVNKFQSTTSTDSKNEKKISLKDQFGRSVANQNGDVKTQNRYEYNNEDYVLNTKHFPNYFSKNPSSGSKTDSWFSTQSSLHDMGGFDQTVMSPDAGHHFSMKNNNGNVAFAVPNGMTQQLVELEINWRYFAHENTLHIEDAKNNIVHSVKTDRYSLAKTDSVYLPEGSYSLKTHDKGGNNWGGSSSVKVKVGDNEVAHLTHGYNHGQDTVSTKVTLNAPEVSQNHYANLKALDSLNQDVKESIQDFSLLDSTDLYISVNWPSWSGENKVEILDEKGTPIYAKCDPRHCFNGRSGAYNDIDTIVSLESGNYKLRTIDSYGDGWNSYGKVSLATSEKNLLSFHHNRNHDKSSFVQKITVPKRPAEVVVETSWPSWSGENKFEIVNDAGNVVYSKCDEGKCYNTASGSYSDLDTIMLSPGHYTVKTWDSYGDSWYRGRVRLVYKGHEIAEYNHKERTKNLATVHSLSFGKDAFYMDNKAARKQFESKYVKYDQLNRPVESGLYKTDLKGLGQMELLANTPFWLSSATQWKKRFQYDHGDGFNTMNYKGRLAKSLYKQNGRIVERTLAYDRRGNVVADTLNFRNDNHGLDASYGVEYSYYPNGKTHKVTYPQGMKVVYSYDNHGRVKGVGSETSPYQYAKYEYTLDGKVASSKLGTNVLEKTNKYNLLGHAQEMLVVKGSNSSDTLFKEDLDYFDNDTTYNAGNISAIDYSGDDLSESVSLDYLYDSQYRLIGALKYLENKISNWTYQYDANGNIDSIKYDDDTRPSFPSNDTRTVQIRPTQNANTLTNRSLLGAQRVETIHNVAVIGGINLQQNTQIPADYEKNFEYLEGKNIRSKNNVSTADGDGRVTDIRTPLFGESSIDYDIYSNMPLSIHKKGDKDQSVKFSYDAQNRRVEKIRSISASSIEDTVLYIHGHGGLPLAEIHKSENGTTQKNFIHGLDYAPIAMVNDLSYSQSNTFYFIRDHLSSLRLAYKGDGTLVTRYEYSPYGNILKNSYHHADEPQAGTMQNAFGYLYTGQEYDEELELHNFRARLYSPTERTFLQIDPKHQYYTPYTFVGNNPINIVDRDGKAGEEGAVGGVGISDNPFRRDDATRLPLKRKGQLEFKQTTYEGSGGGASFRKNLLGIEKKWDKIYNRPKYLSALKEETNPASLELSNDLRVAQGKKALTKEEAMILKPNVKNAHNAMGLQQGAYSSRFTRTYVAQDGLGKTFGVGTLVQDRSGLTMRISSHPYTALRDEGVKIKKGQKAFRDSYEKDFFNYMRKDVAQLRRAGGAAEGVKINSRMENAAERRFKLK